MQQKSTDPAFSPALDPPSLANLTNTELQDQLRDLGEELDRRHAKKQKYKHQLQEEKAKRAVLERHYREKLNEKDEKIKTLVAENNEFKVNSDYVVGSSQTLNILTEISTFRKKHQFRGNVTSRSSKAIAVPHWAVNQL